MQPRDQHWKPALLVCICKRLFQRRVLAIDIIKEVNITVLFNYSSVIDDEYGDRIYQLYAEGLVTDHGVVHTGRRPPGIAQHPGSQSGRMLNAYAAVAEVAAIGREKVLLRRA